jgi:hypothetical protein
MVTHVFEFSEGKNDNSLGLEKPFADYFPG